jgi:hypothetical protein
MSTTVRSLLPIAAAVLPPHVTDAIGIGDI